MNAADWSEATRRVVAEACRPHPDDVVVVVGPEWALVALVAPSVAHVVVVAPGPAPAAVGANVSTQANLVPLPERTSMVLVHDELRRREPSAQRTLVADLGRALPKRGLLVVGDVLWSMPPDQVDEPEQFGADIGNAPRVATLEGWLRESGFLPDTHRFGVGRAVCVALRA